MEPHMAELTHFERAQASRLLAKTKLLRSMRTTILWPSHKACATAFDMYNAHHDKKLLRGCAPCHVDVFNYLLQEVLATITVDA